MVYLLGRDNAYSPGYGIALYLFAQQIATALGELFGVVEQCVLVVGRQNDRCGIDGTGQTAATGLVASGLYESFVIMTFKHTIIDIVVAIFFTLHFYLSKCCQSFSERHEPPHVKPCSVKRRQSRSPRSIL